MFQYAGAVGGRKRKRLEEENAAKDRRIEQLQAEVARLPAALAASERAGKCQAALFSKGPARAHPCRPGCKPGVAWPVENMGL